jgi:hypothetical protein
MRGVVDERSDVVVNMEGRILEMSRGLKETIGEWCMQENIQKSSLHLEPTAFNLLVEEMACDTY